MPEQTYQADLPPNELQKLRDELASKQRELKQAQNMLRAILPLVPEDNSKPVSLEALEAKAVKIEFHELPALYKEQEEWRRNNPGKDNETLGNKVDALKKALSDLKKEIDVADVEINTVAILRDTFHFGLHTHNYNVTISEIENLENQLVEIQKQLIPLSDQQERERAAGKQFNENLWLQIQDLRNQEKKIQAEIDGKEKFKNAYENAQRLENEINVLEARIAAGKSLPEKIRDFNKEIFKYEDDQLAAARHALKQVNLLEKGLAFTVPVHTPTNDALLEKCLTNITNAESLQELELYRDSFTRVIDGMTIVDVTEKLNLANFIGRLQGLLEFPYDEARLLAIKALGNEMNSAHQHLKKYYEKRIQENSKKIADLRLLRDSHSSEKDKDKRIEIEQELRERLIQDRQSRIALQQINQIAEHLNNIFTKAELFDKTKLNDHDDLNKEINALAEYQEQIKKYIQYVRSCKIHVAQLCIVRAAYLKPGYSLIESFAEASDRRQAYILFLAGIMKDADKDKLHKFADENSAGVSSEAFGELIKDELKNIGEVVTAMPLASNQVFNVGTFVFDVINISVELGEAKQHHDIPAKLGERNPKPITGWLLADKALSLFFGVVGLGVSAVLFASSIFTFGATFPAAKTTLVMSSLAIADTIWGGGHFLHDKIDEWNHNSAVQDEVAGLQRLDDAHNHAMEYRHAAEQGAKAPSGDAKQGNENKKGLVPNGGNEAHVFDMLNARPSAPPLSPTKSVDTSASNSSSNLSAILPPRLAIPATPTSIRNPDSSSDCPSVGSTSPSSDWKGAEPPVPGL